MNLFELQERLKDFSQDQLVREMQAPTGSAPQYLVLSELQRRQRMMMEEQAQMDQPQTTVAQDAIAAAGVPQGGLADMAQAMAPRTDMDMNTAVQPVERMQAGGMIGDPLAPYAQHLNQTYSTPKIESFVENVRNMEQQTFGQPSLGMPVPRPFSPAVQPLSQMGALSQQQPPAPLALSPVGPQDVMRSVGGGFAFGGPPAQSQTGAMQQMGSPFGLASLFASRRMADGGVVRMQPGGLARNPQQDEVDALARRIADIAARLEESNRAAARRNRGLSKVSADVGRFMPAAMGAPGMGSDAGLLSDIDPRVSAARTAPGLPPIRPTDRQPILDEAAPPSLSELLDLAGLETMEVGPVQGPRRPPTSMPLIGDSGDLQIQMPDGSLISPLELGITPGELAGAGTADLTGLSGLPSYLDLPSQEDLDMLYAGDQAGLAGRQSELDEAIEADTANRFIAQTFENEANRDAVEKLITPIPESAAPFDLFEYMRGGTEAGPAVMDPLSGAVRNVVERAAETLAFPGLMPPMQGPELPPEGMPTPPVESPITPPGGPSTPPVAGGGGAGGAGAVATATDDAFEQDKWLALAQAGLALMSSRQPTIGGAIGEAGLAGISALRTARGERDERIERAQARADRLAAAAAASAGRGAQYPYRQADDLLKLADAYDKISDSIVAANSGIVPSENDPMYEDYQRNRIRAELTRAEVGAMARSLGMTQASEDEG